MRRLAIFGAVVAATACGSIQAADSPHTVPRLAFAQLYPLTVQGYGFRAHERVRVTVGGPRQAATTVTAGRLGRFTARFAIRAPRCGSLLVRAVGAAGSRASRELPRPDCREP